LTFNHIGFRKRFFIWSSIVSAGVILAAAGVQLVDFVRFALFGVGCSVQVREVFSVEILYALLGLVGISGSFYAAGRMTPGSPEYTPDNLRGLDPTLRPEFFAAPPDAAQAAPRGDRT
jgi:hypothetical protein